MNLSTEIKHIALITPNYPTRRSIERGAFVEALVRQWEREEVVVDVVAPISLPNWLRDLKREAHDTTVAGRRVASALYPTFSSFSVGPVDMKHLNRWLFERAALRIMRGGPIADAYYGKFLQTGGAAAAAAGRQWKRPAFADLGESVLLAGMSLSERRQASTIIRGLTGLVCVSERLRDEAIELGADPDRVLLAPNHPDTRRFLPQDRLECRKKLSLPQDAFVVVFNGHFIPRKGPLRVLEALERSGRPILGVFLGRGNQVPVGPSVFHAGPVPNAEVPVWLNAADLMILPTLAEGHCNAIAEALACGVPILTSDIADVRLQVPEGGAVLVDPMNIDEMAAQLRLLFDEPHRVAQMKNVVIETCVSQARFNRGKQILDWLRSKT